MVLDTIYSRKTAINGKLRPNCVSWYQCARKHRKQLHKAEPCQNRNIVYFDHIATFIFYGIKYRRTCKNACIGLYRFILAIPAGAMPEAIALPLRPIIKNRFNADFRHVNYYSAYIRRNAENAGNRQKTHQNRHISGNHNENHVIVPAPDHWQLYGSAESSAPIISAGGRPYNMPEHWTPCRKRQTKTDQRRQNSRNI